MKQSVSVDDAHVSKGCYKNGKNGYCISDVWVRNSCACSVMNGSSIRVLQRTEQNTKAAIIFLSKSRLMSLHHVGETGFWHADVMIVDNIPWSVP